MVRRLMGAEIPVVTAERYAGSLQPAGVVWSDHKVTFRQLLDHVRGSGARLPALLDYVLTRPVVSAGMIAEELMVTPRAAQNMVAALGLREATGRGRYRAWGIL